MAELAKKIVSVEILHLDELGYGHEGKHTRRQWREECLKNLLAGKEQFKAWQQTLVTQTSYDEEETKFEVFVTFDDGEKLLYDTGAFKFELEMDFVGHNFLDELNLSSYYFSLHANFSFAVFEKSVFLTRATFEKDLICNYVTFKSKSWFDSAVFLGEIYFNNVKFDHARFCGASFNKQTNFSKSTFEKYAGFSKTIFTERAFFNNVIFNDNALFKNTFFKDKTDFNSTVFKGSIEFYSTVFEEKSSFENAVFNKVCHFEQVIFRNLLPSFRGCIIDISRLEFSDDSHFPQDDFSEDAIKNISFLKRLSDEHGQVDQALNFNAMELRAKRKNSWQTLSPDKAWLNLLSFWPFDQIFIDFLWKIIVWLSIIFSGQFWFCLFTWLYEKISDFGRSFTKPLFYLVILFSLSYLFGVFSAFENSPAKASHSRQPIFEELARVYNYNQPNQPQDYLKISAYRAATEYSLYRSGNFLDFTDADKNTASINMRLFGSEIEPWWARIFGFFKGIITAILLFLIALGLRNKYRVS